MAAPVSTDPTFLPGLAQRLFEYSNFSSGHPEYDVSAGRFLLVKDVAANGEVAKPKIRIVQNWYEEFRDREE